MTRSVVGEPGVNEALLHDARHGRWLLFRSPRSVMTARRLHEVNDVLSAVENDTRKRGAWAAGFIAYEAAPAFDPALSVRPDGEFPLVWFGLYDAPAEVKLPPPPARTTRLSWRPSVTPREYGRAIRRIRAYIRAGDTYQVNYTFRLRASGLHDPWALFLRMLGEQATAYAAYLRTGRWALCSASPELFLRRENTSIESRPMKGTACRGLWPAQDRRQADFLRRSEKNRAENVMIVDMVRNDLGRVAEAGTVRVPAIFQVERYPTVWQMTSTVVARTSAPLTAVLAATFPPASITGAPKRRTMEIIAELESSPRRIYTGAIGFLAPGRRAQFSVAIRTALLDRRRGTGEYGVGGGIVWDSDAADERVECQTKARILEADPAPFELLETLLWTPRKGYRLLGRHLRRLAESASYFDFACDGRRIRRELARLSRSLSPVPHRVRLLLARDGRRRYESAVCRPIAGRGPPRVAFARSPVDSRNVLLYHKTTHRGVYQDALAERPGCDDVILHNERGEVTESTIANVVADIGGVLYTPPLECGLLAGTARASMLSRGEIRERVITVEQLRRARRLFLVNSVRGMYEVKLQGGNGA